MKRLQAKLKGIYKETKGKGLFSQYDEVALGKLFENVELNFSDKKDNSKGSLVDFSSKCAEPDRKIFVRANAGHGKTFLSQCVSLQWAMNVNQWDKYELVLCIPLRKLNTYKKSKMTFIEFIENVCFNNTLTSPEKETLKEILGDYDKRKSILWVLDGYDEIDFKSLEACSVISNYWSILFNNSNVILTMRPGYENNIQTLPDLIVKIPPLSDEQITKFLNERLSLVYNHEEEKINYAIAALRNDSYIWRLLRTPIHIDIICNMIKMDNDLSFMLKTPVALYEEMLFRLLKRLVQERGYEGKYCVELKTKSQIFNFFKKHLSIMELLAYRGINANVKLFSEDDINVSFQSAQAESKQREFILEEIHDIGIVTFFDGFKKAEFIHPIFQEYFAARYFERNVFNLDEEVDVMQEDFILTLRAQKYNPQFQSVWAFVAGLLGKKPNRLELYFDVLLSEPRELLGLYEFPLYFNCLEQSQLGVNSELGQNLLAYFKRALPSLIFEDDVSDFIVDNLKDCPLLAENTILERLLSVLEHDVPSRENERFARSITTFFVGALVEGFTGKKLPRMNLKGTKTKSEIMSRVVGIIGTLRVGVPKVIERLNKLLKHSDKELCFSAHMALRKLNVPNIKTSQAEESKKMDSVNESSESEDEIAGHIQEENEPDALQLWKIIESLNSLDRDQVASGLLALNKKSDFIAHQDELIDKIHSTINNKEWELQSIYYLLHILLLYYSSSVLPEEIICQLENFVRSTQSLQWLEGEYAQICVEIESEEHDQIESLREKILTPIVLGVMFSPSSIAKESSLLVLLSVLLIPNIVDEKSKRFLSRVTRSLLIGENYILLDLIQKICSASEDELSHAIKSFSEALKNIDNQLHAEYLNAIDGLDEDEIKRWLLKSFVRIRRGLNEFARQSLEILMFQEKLGEKTISTMGDMIQEIIFSPSVYSSEFCSRSVAFLIMKDTTRLLAILESTATEQNVKKLIISVVNDFYADKISHTLLSATVDELLKLDDNSLIEGMISQLNKIKDETSAVLLCKIITYKLDHIDHKNVGEIRSVISLLRSLSSDHFLDSYSDFLCKIISFVFDKIYKKIDEILGVPEEEVVKIEIIPELEEYDLAIDLLSLMYWNIRIVIENDDIINLLLQASSKINQAINLIMSKILSSNGETQEKLSEYYGKTARQLSKILEKILEILGKIPQKKMSNEMISHFIDCLASENSKIVDTVLSILGKLNIINLGDEHFSRITNFSKNATKNYLCTRDKEVLDRRIQRIVRALSKVSSIDQLLSLYKEELPEAKAEKKLFEYFRVKAIMLKIYNHRLLLYFQGDKVFWYASGKNKESSSLSNHQALTLQADLQTFHREEVLRDTPFIFNTTIGYTPLHWACKKRDHCLGEATLKNHPSVIDTQRNVKRRTPAMLSVLEGDMVMLRMLVKRGANLNFVDKNFESPIGMAYRLNKKDILCFLIAHQSREKIDEFIDTLMQYSFGKINKEMNSQDKMNLALYFVASLCERSPDEIVQLIKKNFNSYSNNLSYYKDSENNEVKEISIIDYLTIRIFCLFRFLLNLETKNMKLKMFKKEQLQHCLKNEIQTDCQLLKFLRMLEYACCSEDADLLMESISSYVINSVSNLNSGQAFVLALPYKSVEYAIDHNKVQKKHINAELEEYIRHFNDLSDILSRLVVIESVDGLSVDQKKQKIEFEGMLETVRNYIKRKTGKSVQECLTSSCKLTYEYVVFSASQKIFQIRFGSNVSKLSFKSFGKEYYKKLLTSFTINTGQKFVCTLLKDEGYQEQFKYRLKDDTLYEFLLSQELLILSDTMKCLESVKKQPSMSTSRFTFHAPIYIVSDSIVSSGPVGNITHAGHHNKYDNEGDVKITNNNDDKGCLLM